MARDQTLELVPRIPLSLQQLIDYYKSAVSECDFIEPILLSGLENIEARMKPSPLLSVRFNKYEDYYVDFLRHLQWRLSPLFVHKSYKFAQSQDIAALLAHDYAHSGVAHPVDEQEIDPMLESIDTIRTHLTRVISQIEVDMLKSLFLCHSSSDKDVVRKIAGDLTLRGAQVWLDEAEILVGDSIIEKIQKGIAESDFLGVVLSPRSVESIWVKREVEAALIDEIESGRTRVLPLLLEQCEIPPFLRSKRYADFTSAENYEMGLSALSASLSRR